MAPPKSEFDKQMQYLEAEIRRLEAEFNMFFAGRLPRPPWETRAKVAALVKRHDQSFIRNTADRFRFESLQNRHAKFIELWERQMTNRELGPVDVGREEGGAHARHAGGHPARRAAGRRRGGGRPLHARPLNASSSSAAPTIPARDRRRVKELYEQLAQAKKQVGEEPVAFERVQALVRAQVDKFGADGNVAFKIGMKDGKVSLTVKPEKDKG